MIDLTDKKYDYAKKMGYVTNERDWEYTFVGAWLKKYPNRVGVLETFSEILGHTPTWEDITDRTLKEFRDAISENMCSNSVRSTFQKLKAVINDNKEEVNIPTTRYSEVLKARQEPCKNVFLNQEELLKLENTETYSRMEHYVQAVFLISCYTGARHSDAMLIKSTNVEDSVLHYVSIKTRKLSYIKAHETLLKMIKQKEEIEQERRIHVSDAWFNKTIRELCRRAGINDRVQVFNAGKEIVGEKWEFVKSHTGRRSFVTNKLIEGHSIETICKAAGHSDLNMTFRYVSGNIEAI